MNRTLSRLLLVFFAILLTASIIWACFDYYFQDDGFMTMVLVTPTPIPTA